MTPTPLFAPLLLAVASLAAASTATTVTLSSSANPSENGHSVTIRATVSPAGATGNVTFYDGTVVLGTSPVASGLAAFTTVLLPADVQPLTAYYGGDSTYASSTSAVFKQNVTPVAANSFQSVVSYSVDSEGFWAVVGDFNEDGKPDIAVSFEEGVQIFLGNGDGSFQAPTTYSFLTGAGEGLAAGDFNQDGHTDLAFPGGVLLGNGDGSFSYPVWFSIAAYEGSSVAVGDFNGDGYPDVVVTLSIASTASTEFCLLLNNGDGSFAPPVNYAVGTSPQAVAIGDFNGDGKADLAVGDNSGSVEIYLGNGDGTFQTPTSIVDAGFGYTLSAADVNSDGKLDLALGGGNGVSILLGNGNGTFQAPNVYDGFYAPAMIVADIDGDGKQDIVVGEGETDFAVTLLGSGNGIFQVGPSYATNHAVYGAVAADFNGDGRTDIAFVGEDYTTGDPSFLDIFLAASGQGTVTTISSTTNPSTFSQNATFTSTVSPATATGTVTFADGVNLLSVAPITGGVASYTTSQLSAGSYSLRAVYSGDATNSSSGSKVITQTVNPSPSTTTLSSDLNPSVFSDRVQFTATIVPNQAIGTVMFLDGSTAIGSVSFCCGSATFEISSLAVGLHSMTAVSSGADILSSSSSPVIQAVGHHASEVSISAAPNPSSVGQSVLITSDVKPHTATGSVTFRAGNTVIGTVALNQRGVANLSISALPEGTYALTAEYSGNSVYKPSTSGLFTQTVN